MGNCWMVRAGLNHVPQSGVFRLLKGCFASFEAFFIRPFYKMMLQKPITLQDMESVVSGAVNQHLHPSQPLF